MRYCFDISEVVDWIWYQAKTYDYWEFDLDLIVQLSIDALRIQDQPLPIDIVVQHAIHNGQVPNYNNTEGTHDHLYYLITQAIYYRIAKILTHMELYGYARSHNIQSGYIEGTTLYIESIF